MGDIKLLFTTIAAVLVVGCGPPEPPDFSIHEAVGIGNIEAVKQHLAAGTDVNAETRDRVTPLHPAAANGHKEIAELLVAEGADVNAKDDKKGWTPLLIAAVAGHKETAELLIAKGADVNAKAVTGETPLDSAIKSKNTETANLLRKHGGKTSEELKAEGK